ncbi:MAG TPA: hypothetical protein VHC90_21455 [Bryobacteraceae bacterium]|nr:hypothetical protein [Bryobacteraceae bacterium]
MTEDQIRELFREMRDEPVPPDSKARVRMAVAERTQNWPEKLRRRWKWMAAVLAPACLLLIFLIARGKTPGAPPAPVVQAPVVASVKAPPAPPPRPHIVRARHRIAKPRQEPVASGANLIRIETPDPNVVILLVGG